MTGLSEPRRVEIRQVRGQRARLTATYSPDGDNPPADGWRVWLTVDGGDPRASRGRVVPFGVPGVGGHHELVHETGALGVGVHVRACIAVQRSGPPVEVSPWIDLPREVWVRIIGGEN